MAVKKDFRNYFASEKIAIDSQYDNVILVDPNKVEGPDGIVTDRLVEHENLVMYANLEARMIPRTKLAAGVNFDEKATNLEIANFGGTEDGKVNFLKPQGKQYLDSSWTEQFTGQDSLNGGGVNQSQETTQGSGTNKRYIRNVRNTMDTQLLGITSIKISNSSSFIPQVQIELTDVQGRTLFEQGENSPYSAFMQLPYPLFFLTVKGYYGKAVRYELMLKSFNARFDPSDGNYRISLSFIGRTAAILSDLPLGTLFALPHMYESTFAIENNTQTATGTDNITSDYESYQRVTVTRGYKKIEEVFKYYKNEGLIDNDLPVLTLSQLSSRLSGIEAFITETFQEEDLTVLNDIDEYRTSLITYRDDVSLFTNGTWFKKSIDPLSRFVSQNGDIYYVLKKTLRSDKTKREAAVNELESLFEKYNEELNDNVTFGKNGSFKIKSIKTERGSSISSSQAFQFELSDILYDLDPENIDFEKTFILQKGSVPTATELNAFKTSLMLEFALTETVIDAKTLEPRTESTYFFNYGNVYESSNYAKNSFLKRFSTLEDKFNKTAEDIEKALSDALAQKIENPDGGLGFRPTIRNVMAYLMANVDAFYRLMDDVHRNAWNIKDDPIRLQVLPGGSDAVDSKDMVDNGSSANNRFIYPWPQYFEKELDDGGNEKYVVKYIGDPLISSKTKAYMTDKWPEVEFVEQYIKGQLQREEEPVSDEPKNQKEQANFIGATPVEYPYDIIPYSNLSEVPFLYELWERTYLMSNYSNVFRGNQSRQDLYSVFGDFEASTIMESIKSDPFLQLKLKQYKLNFNTFESLLQNISNGGNGPSWNLHIRDNYTTNYIRNYAENSFGLYPLNTWWDSPDIDLAQESQEKLQTFLKDGQTNDLSLVDVYPFTSQSWLKSNMANGNSYNTPEDFNDTTGSYFFAETKKCITSFDSKSFETYNYTPSMPTEWLLNTNITVNGTTAETLKLGFQTKVNGNLYSVSEGKLDYGADFKGNTSKIQNLSLLNTPYFTNALVDGVDKEKNGDDNPYAALGYIFLNSLPIITLREKFLNGDFAAATFNKFAALHKVPDAWVYKMGSIWHRYKKYHQDGIDILDDVWKPIDQEKLYDPIYEDSSTEYTVKRIDGRRYNYEQNSIGLTIPNVNLGRVNVGLYPKVINSVSNYFGYEDIISSGGTENDWQKAYNGETGFFGGGLRMGSPNNAMVNFTSGQIPSQPNKTIGINSWYTYYDKPDIFSLNQSDEVIVFPSVGGLNFSQYGLEKRNVAGIVDGAPVDQTLYDGSVRTLWGAGHYGYYDNSLIVKPAYNEYIKIIDSGSTTQQSFNLSSTSEYANIEEILSVFSKEIMDLFESKFLRYCDHLNEGGSAEISTPLSFEPPADDTDILKNFNLRETLKSLFIVTRPPLTGNEDDNGSEIAKVQLKDFTTGMNTFLSQKSIFKQGNPGNFDRRVWDSFSTNAGFNPVDKINFGNYVSNTLPTNGGTITYAQSISINSDAWEAMYLNIGEYKNTNLIYSDNGSYLTDFFVDLDVEFTAENVQRLSKVIQIYASEKLKDDTLTPTDFYNTFNTYIESLNKYQSNIQNHIFQYLNRRLPEVTEEQENKRSALNGDVAKLELYETFKVLNDKWIAGGDFQNRTLFEDFLFFDRANRNIGDKIIVSISALAAHLTPRNQKQSIYGMIGYLLQENNFIFMALPTYTNFYGIPETTKNSTPTENSNTSASDAFGTFLEVDTRKTRPKFLCLYTDKVSEHLDHKENTDYRFRSDSFDLRKSDNPLRENQTNKTDWGLSNKVVAFNVDFGIQNQNMFQSVTLDQAQYKDTSETFTILTDMANQAKGQKAMQQSTSLFNIYKSRSYTCDVISMGNVMIQPSMYFNLRYVPMFTGPYWITDVTHNITPTNFLTTFSGVRISKFSFPSVDNLMMSVNRDLIRKYKKPRKVQTNSQGGDTGSTENNNQSGIASNTTNQGEGKCQGKSKHPDLPYLKVTEQTIPVNEVLSTAKQLGSTNDIRRIIAGAPRIEQGDGNFVNAYNYNCVGMHSDNKWASALISRAVGQTCLKVSDTDSNGNKTYRPTFAFDSLKDGLNGITIRMEGSKGAITELITFVSNGSQNPTDNELAQVYALMWFGFWNTGLGFRAGGIDNIKSVLTPGTKLYKDYNKKIVTATSIYKKVIILAKAKGF